jgi:hypothetical protein
MVFQNHHIRTQASGQGFDNVDFVIDTLSLYGDVETVNDHKCGVYDVPGKYMIMKFPATLHTNDRVRRGSSSSGIRTRKAILG